MSEWQENKTITPPQETQLELQLPPNNGNTDGASEEEVRSLIGLVQTLTTLSVSSARLLDTTRQYSLDIPVTEAHLLSGLWGTASLLMSTLDLLRIYRRTYKASPPIMQSEREIEETLETGDLEVMILMQYLAQ